MKINIPLEKQVIEENGKASLKITKSYEIETNDVVGVVRSIGETSFQPKVGFELCDGTRVRTNTQMIDDAARLGVLGCDLNRFYEIFPELKWRGC